MRDAYNDDVGAPVPTIRVKVKYYATYHEINISAQDTFGKMKKELFARMGLHPLDTKLMYKENESASTTFLDAVSVKDSSIIQLMEDPMAKAKCLLEITRLTNWQGRKVYLCNPPRGRPSCLQGGWLPGAQSIESGKKLLLLKEIVQDLELLGSPLLLLLWWVVFYSLDYCLEANKGFPEVQSSFCDS
ncbi:BAG family molecular chaperone regulator 1-like isoform X2 [Zingiber officinale]|nr:BAG family molecular chaperone regulator 1-like isoform X2 [Zingiber officinale]